MPGPNASPLVPWTQATAALVRKAGTSTTVRAPTVGLACDVENLAFETGQPVALQLVRNVRFDAIYADNASTDGVVTLLDGRQVTEPMHTWNCPVTGTNEHGSVVIELQDIARIDFHR